jgi:hypothetical protein
VEMGAGNERKNPRTDGATVGRREVNVMILVREAR